MKTRRDVVDELYFEHWSIASRRQSHGCSDDGGFSERSVADSVGKSGAQTSCQPENPALRILDVLSKDHYAPVFFHSCVKGLIDRFDHRGGLPRRLERNRRSVHRRSVEMLQHTSRIGRGLAGSLLVSRVNEVLNLDLHLFELFHCQQSLSN